MTAMFLFILVSASLVTTILQMVVPIVTGLLTKYTLASWIKGVLTLLLNGVVAILDNNMQHDGSALISGLTLQKTLIGFVISVAMYFGIYKQANLTSSTPTGKLLPHTGIGPAVGPPAAPGP